MSFDNLPKMHPREADVRATAGVFASAVIDLKLAFDVEVLLLGQLLLHAKSDDLPQSPPPVEGALRKPYIRLIPAWKAFAEKTTHGERVATIANMTSSVSKYQVRFERHGNYKDPGGLE